MLKELEILLTGFNNYNDSNKSNSNTILQHLNNNGLTVSHELREKLLNMVQKLTNDILDDKSKNFKDNEITISILKGEN